MTVKGSEQPMRVYSVTLDYKDLEPIEDRFLKLDNKTKKEQRNLEKKTINKKLTTGARKTGDLVNKDADFLELRRHLNVEMEAKFAIAYGKYLGGDWATAEDLLSECLKMEPLDGPTKTLKNYIEKRNGVPP